MAYVIEFHADAEEHFKGLTANQQAQVLDAIEVQLRHQPLVETRNRKVMRENPLAKWELRIGKLRVFYLVEEEPQPLVRIRAIGIKERNRIRFGNTECEL